MLGLSYAVADNGGVFTLEETMPTEWSYMEAYVPLTVDGQTKWTHVRVDRNEADRIADKKSKRTGGNYQRLLNLSHGLKVRRFRQGLPITQPQICCIEPHGSYHLSILGSRYAIDSYRINQHVIRRSNDKELLVST